VELRDYHVRMTPRVTSKYGHSEGITMAKPKSVQKVRRAQHKKLSFPEYL
jgi:hypothetical protein